MELDFDPLDIPPPRPSPHRSRRLRKKLFIEEFQQFGFHVGFRLNPDLSAGQLEQMFDRFLMEAIEGNSLSCGGGGSLTEMSFYVMGSGPHRRQVSATEEQRQAVLSWLEDNRANGVVDFAASPLMDANYDPA